VIGYCATNVFSAHLAAFLLTEPAFLLHKMKAKSSSTGEESMSDSDDDENGDDDMEAETADLWEDIGEMKQTSIMVRNRCLREKNH
jgi:hypothetical protein